MGVVHKTNKYCRNYLLFLLFVILLGFHIGNVTAVPAKRSVVNCDQYKFSVHHPNQLHYCMPCKICPAQAGVELHNSACKQKIPHEIPGQGRAWCTGINDKPPSCNHLSVSNGILACNSNNEVYSKCKLLCKSGYTPGHSSWTHLECLDNLQWNISGQSQLSCNRTAKPDKPSVISHGQRQEVMAGSEKTLFCVPSSEVVGKRQTYWYFKDKQLPSNYDLDIFVVRRASIDNDGEYFCQVQDENGKSDLSAGYLLTVETSNTGSSDRMWITGVLAILVVPAALLTLGVICVCYKNDATHRHCTILWHRMTKCQHHDKDEIGKSCMSSAVSSVGGYSGVSGTSGSSLSDNGTISEEEKQPHMDKYILKLIPAETESLLEKKGLLNSKPKNPEYDDIGNFHENNKISSIMCGDPAAISETDRNELRSFLKNSKHMNQIIRLLDRKAGSDEEKPTFHSLGRYLGDSPDEIAHLEFKCQQSRSSPTEHYIRKMTHYGHGFSTLLKFLKDYKCSEILAEEREDHLSCNC